MSLENFVTLPTLPSKKKKIKIEWLTIFATVLSLILGVAATGSGMLRDYYNEKLEEKKINFEILKAIKSDYKEEQADLLKRMRTLSMVQICLVEAIEFCKTNKKSLHKNTFIHQELLKKQDNLVSAFKKFLNESIDLETHYGKEVHEKANYFARKVEQYRNVCQADVPTESEWIKWQNATVSAMNKSLEKKYNKYQELIVKNLE